jgi:hypothetical protein
VRALAALVIHGHGRAAARFNEVDLGNQPEARGRDRHRAGVDLLFGILYARFRQIARASVDALVPVPALDGVRRVRPFALHPFQVREARAVLVLVHHARGQQRHVPGELGERKGKLRLFRGVHGR